MNEETIIRTAVVTGGSRGIGRAVCVQLARQGCHVVVNYCHGEAAAAETVSLCRAMGAQAVAVQADVSTAEGCKKLFEEAGKRLWPGGYPCEQCRHHPGQPDPAHVRSRL